MSPMFYHCAGAAAVEAPVELSAKDIKAAEKAARKIELAAKKEARLAAKKSGDTVEVEGESNGNEEELTEEVDAGLKSLVV